MADADDVRGPLLALLHHAGMTATIVGVPLLVARRLTRRRGPLVLPLALGVAAVLNASTQRSAWSLVRLWLRIDEPVTGRGGRATRPLSPRAGSPRRSSPRRGA